MKIVFLPKKITIIACLITLLPPTLWASTKTLHDNVFLNESQLIHAIKMGRHHLISDKKIEAHLLNKIYRNETPLMIAIDALGSLMAQNEQTYNKAQEPEYKNIVGPMLFVLATGGASTYIYNNEGKKKKIFKFGSLEDIMENPIAIPGAMLFGGLIWLLPDLYHNSKTAYYALIANDLLNTKEIKTHYNIVVRLLNHPDINLSLADSNGAIALDLLHKWQNTITNPSYKPLLINLEKQMLDKMYDVKKRA